MGIEDGKDSENVKKTETMKFYDIHCHAFTWSHLNVLLFLKRFNFNLLCATAPILGPFIGLFGRNTLRNYHNLLSVMENDLGSYFLLMEYFLKNKEPKVVSPDNTFTIGDLTFKKIVLTPLIMDFGYRNIKQPGIFYNIPPRKPIRVVVIDLLNGIRTYCENKLVPHKTESKLTQVPDEKDNKLFEIYPFLGINTKNYTEFKLKRLLDKYFKDYEGKQQPLYDNMGKFDGDINEIGFGSNFFAGIKVYPSLGFDPWPDDNDERVKVKILYKYCIDKGIPVTTHCSDGGFRVKSVVNASTYLAPGMRWTKVLEEYPELKINFAHFGYQSKLLWLFPRTQWRNSIIELMLEKTEDSKLKYPNIYTDFSSLALSDTYYKYIDDLISKESNNILKERILFGTEFLISLIWNHSYNEALNLFKETNYLQSLIKENFCSKNPEKFLFN